METRDVIPTILAVAALALGVGELFDRLSNSTRVPTWVVPLAVILLAVAFLWGIVT